MKILPSHAIVLALVAAVERSSTAAEALTFDAAIGLAASTPRVLASEQAVREKETLDARIASVPFNPQIAVQPGWRFAPRDARQPELIVEVLQPWSLAGQGRARRSAAVAEEEVLRAEARAVALAGRLGAARAWIDLWAAERTLEEIRREEAIAAELERLVDRGAALGAMTRADLAEARAYHADARVAVLSAEGELFQRGIALARETADRRAGPLRTTGPLPEPAVPDRSRVGEYLARMTTLPPVAVRDLQMRASQAREVEERAARGAVAQLGAGVQRDAPGGLVVSALARVTLPLIEHGERERAALRADAVRLEGERDDALIAARTELTSTFHEVAHTAEVLAVLRDDLAPASREAAETRRRIFQNGGATLLEVLQSDRAAVVAASRLRRMEAEHAWSRTKLWLIVAEVALREARP